MNSKTLITFLICFYMLVNIKPVVCLAMYEINFEYIATVLCINKDRTDLPKSCDGMCQLSKEIEEKEKQDRLSNSHDNLLPHDITFQLNILLQNTERIFCSNLIKTPEFNPVTFTPPPQV